VRGPSMSATPGKVLIDGVAEIHGEKVFVLKFIQGRNPEWAGQVFFAKYDETARWLDDLRPAFGESWAWKDELESMKETGWTGDWNTDSHISKRVSKCGHVQFAPQ
jgi:hypothetical protein